MDPFRPLPADVACRRRLCCAHSLLIIQASRNFLRDDLPARKQVGQVGQASRRIVLVRKIIDDAVPSMKLEQANGAELRLNVSAHVVPPLMFPKAVNRQGLQGNRSYLIYIYICMYVYIYIYIYVCISISLSLYIYIYTHIHMPRNHHMTGLPRVPGFGPGVLFIDQRVHEKLANSNLHSKRAAPDDSRPLLQGGPPEFTELLPIVG